MVLIADTNIIMSALMKPSGVVASVFKEKQVTQFIAPNYLLVEIHNYWNKIKRYSSLSEFDLVKELRLYESIIVFYAPENVPQKYKTKAYDLTNDIDPKDIAFVALHLYKKHKIWTGDKKLIKGLTAKGYGHIFVTTAQLKEKLYKR